ncbi:tetratricopeptide repeat protein [Catenulispora rubra]|uniref:tetratricopeptide repeat protein n=1 Tax=Catenulispora rubra TaxID=280293 RepID=UPI00189243F4|nr:tetratricopeptide repeat protein [Catenulispora rubra]
MRSDLSGNAGDVVQARDIAGGIHFHTGPAPSSVIPRQLPGRIHGFVNRTADLAGLDAALLAEDGQSMAAAVCVIAGTAGVGKTSLAVHWAHQHRALFPDGQLYINLHGYDPGDPVEAGQALTRFLIALGIEPGAVPSEVEVRSALYRSLLAERRVLVVLDNAATVGQVRPLLPGAHGCLVVVTSRSRLSGLVARDGAHRATLEVFPEAEAVHLLQATTAPYRAKDSDEEVAELARLCARLPLALRIAAERAAARPKMPLSDLIHDLCDESSLWDALSSQDDDEADAVRTVFAWSYRALSPTAARMFRLLGLCPGASFTPHAAAALAEVSLRQAQQDLDALAGAHLLEHSDQGRYQFHDLLRAYAQGQAAHLEDPKDRHDALARLGHWYLQCMVAAIDRLKTHDPGFDPQAWGVVLESPVADPVVSFADGAEATAWLDRETGNLVATACAAATSGFDAIAWALLAALWRPFIETNPVTAWLALGQIELDCARRLGDLSAASHALQGQGIELRLAHRIDEAIEIHREALEAARAAGSTIQNAAALFTLGAAYLRGRRLREARDCFEQVIAAAPQATRRWSDASRNGLVHVLYDAGLLAEARAACADCLSDSEFDASARIEVLLILALTESETGRTEEALDHITEANDHLQRAHYSQTEGRWAGVCKGRVLLATDQPEEALTILQSTAAASRQSGDRLREVFAFDATGQAYHALGRFDEAADFHRAALTLCRDLHDPWPQAVILDHLAAALSALGQSAAASEAWLEARDLLTDFNDPRAQRLRVDVNAAIALP